jgi:hypothetical protein
MSVVDKESAELVELGESVVERARAAGADVAFTAARTSP